jgi:hypothetical protein
MPDFDLSIDIYLLAVMLTLAMAAGFLLRSRQLAKKKRQIGKLEREVMEANAELLDMQKDYCKLESKVKQEDSLVIQLKTSTEPGTGKIENF